MWNRVRQWMKASRPADRRAGPGPRRLARRRPAGWWRDDHVEQLRNYQSWVYAAVNAIAQEVARQRPFLFLNTGQADHEQTPLPHTHPLARLLDHPNPWTDAVGTLVSDGPLPGTDRQLLLVRRPDAASGQPGELWIVPTPWVRVVPDPTQFVHGVRGRRPRACRPRCSPRTRSSTSSIRTRSTSHYGLSPLQANALTIDANTELQKSRYQTFLAGQRPGIVLQTDQTLTEPTIRRLEEKIQARFGGRENWHRPLVLEQGLKASPWTLTPAEMDYLNSSKLSRDEIFALFRVPPPIAGIVENMGLGADIWYGARVMFCEGTVQPKLDLIGAGADARPGPAVRPGRDDRVPRLLAAQPGPAPRRRRAGREDRAADVTTRSAAAAGCGRTRTSRFDEPMLPGRMTG